MIPAGRSAVDRVELIALYGPEAATSRPWLAPDHPAPLNSPGGRKPGLWDAEQVRAHAQGQPVPVLPTEQHPNDLLDITEAAVELGVSRQTMSNYVSAGSFVSPDAQDARVAWQPHWYRSTVEAFRGSRPGRGAGGGRPIGSPGTPPRGRDEVYRRGAELIAAAASRGEAWSARALGRELGVHTTTASKMLRAAADGESARA